MVQSLNRSVWGWMSVVVLGGTTAWAAAPWNAVEDPPAASEVSGDAGGSSAETVAAEGETPVVAAGPPVDPFLSPEALPESHSFRRLAQLREVVEACELAVQESRRQAEEAGHEMRALRQQAQRDRDALLRESDEQVAAVLSAWVEQSKARVHEQLAVERLEGWQAWCLSMEDVLSKTQVDAATQLGASVEARCSTGWREAMAGGVARVQKEHARTAQRMDRSARVIGDELRSLARARLVQPVRESLEHATSLRTVCDEAYVSRVKRTRGQLQKLEQELGERIDCAARRTRESLASQLRQRLSRHELPAAGEMAAAIDHVRSQLDEFTERFLLRTHGALAAFEVGQEASHDAFTVAAPARWVASHDALAALDEALREDLERAALEVAQVPSMKTVDAHGIVLRARLSEARSAVRHGFVCFAAECARHRQQTEEHFADLQRAMQTIVGQAADDCWKFEGPFLDGRFPLRGAPKGALASLESGIQRR